MTINAATSHDPVTAPPVYHFYLDVSQDHAGKEIVRWHDGKMTILSNDGKVEIDQDSINHIFEDGAPLGLVAYEDGAFLFRVPDLDGDGKPELASLNTGEILHTPLYTYKTPHDHPTVTFHKSGDPIHESYVMHPDVFSAVSGGRKLVDAKTERHDFTPVYTIQWDIDPKIEGKEVITIRDRVSSRGSNITLRDVQGNVLPATFERNYDIHEAYVDFPNSPNAFEVRFTTANPNDDGYFCIGNDAQGLILANAPTGYYRPSHVSSPDRGYKSSIGEPTIAVEGKTPDPQYSVVSVFSSYVDTKW